MVTGETSYLSMTVENTQVAMDLVLTASELPQFRNVTKRSTLPIGGGSARTYDLNFGSVNNASAPFTLHNDIIPFEYNSQDFDMNNEIIFEDLLSLSGNDPVFFDVVQTSTGGTTRKSDLVVSTENSPGFTQCDVLVKRLSIDDLATGISNPFISQTILAADTFFGMGSNPISRAGTIIGYDFVLMYFPVP